MNTAQPEKTLGCTQKNGTPLVSPTPSTPRRTRKHGRFMVRSPEVIEQSDPQVLADLLRHAANIAVRVSDHCGDEALRTICLGLAVHCSSIAARIQRQLLWPPG